MFKKSISMLLVCAMLITLSPAISVSGASDIPSVEEILDNYHRKSYEAHTASDASGAAAYSRQNGSSAKTLEQETADELTAAGYEAYNVTSANYDSVEESLNTDLSDLGIDMDGSYIVVVGGEKESTESNSTRASDILLPPHLEIGDDNLQSSFYYTYQGTRHLMRFVTVTGDTESKFVQVTSKPLFNSAVESIIKNALEAAITSILDEIDEDLMFGTISSILGVEFVRFQTNKTADFSMRVGTVWTRVYTQIYNSERGLWLTWSSVEYVDHTVTLDGMYYDTELNKFVTLNEVPVEKTTYTEHYFDYDYRKEMAARAWAQQWPIHELTGDVYYYHGAVLFVTHQEPIVTL